MEPHIARFIDGKWVLGEAIQPGILSGLTDWGWPQLVALCIAGISLLFTIIMIIASTFNVNKEFERSIVLRLGRFHAVKGPGFFITLPFFEKILKTVDLFTQATKLNVEQSLTRDTVAVTVTTVVFWKIVDPRLAVIDVQDYDDAIHQAAQSAMREAIGNHDLSELLSNRASMDLHIKTVLDERTKPWGVEVESVDIQDVQIPDDLQDAMSRQAQATQEGLARQKLAESEKRVAELTVEAARIYDMVPTALKLREMGLTYEMGKNSNTIIVPSSMASSLIGAVALTQAVQSTS